MPNLRNLWADADMTAAVVRTTLAAWANRDLDGALAGFNDSVVHVFNVDAAVIPFGAPIEGKTALRKQLQLLLDTFDFNAFVVDHIRIDGQMAYVGNSIDYVHKATGERLQTRFRFVMTTENGLIARMEEYHDAAFVEAFMRLVATK